MKAGTRVVLLRDLSPTRSTSVDMPARVVGQTGTLAQDAEPAKWPFVTVRWDDGTPPRGVRVSYLGVLPQELVLPDA